MNLQQLTDQHVPSFVDEFTKMTSCLQALGTPVPEAMKKRNFY